MAGLYAARKFSYFFSSERSVADARRSFFSLIRALSRVGTVSFTRATKELSPELAEGRDVESLPPQAYQVPFSLIEIFTNRRS